jgi:hypothetical protein
MLEQIHPLATEAARLGVTSSTLSEAVSKSRGCANRSAEDIRDRARFDARSARCIGFVPAESYARNGDVLAPAPLTAAEIEAVRLGNLTPEEAEDEARARVAAEQRPAAPSAGPEAYATNPGRWAHNPGEWEDEEARIERRASEIAAAQLAEREAQRRAAVQVTQAQPAPVPASDVAGDVEDDEDDEPESDDEDAYVEAELWFVQMNEDDRRAFILEHGETFIEEEVKDRLEDMAARDEIDRNNAVKAKAHAAAIVADDAHDAASGEGYALPETEDGDMGGRLVAVDLDGDGDADAVVEEGALSIFAKTFLTVGTLGLVNFFDDEEEPEDDEPEQVAAVPAADAKATDAPADGKTPTRQAA